MPDKVEMGMGILTILEGDVQLVVDAVLRFLPVNLQLGELGKVASTMKAILQSTKEFGGVHR